MTVGNFETFEINDFRGGQVDLPLRKLNQSPLCRNVIARGLDLLEKRRGQERLNLEALPAAINGAHAYYNGTTRLLVVAAGGKAYQYDPSDRTFTEIKSGISAINPVQFVTCANYMVAFDGETVPWKFNGLAVTDLANAPADGYLACLYKEKLFTVSKSDPSVLLWSDSFQPEVWTPENYWTVGDGDGQAITAIHTYGKQNHLAIFKNRAVYALYGTSLEDFELPPSRSHHGVVGPNAVVESTSGIVYYVSSDGIFAYDGYAAVEITKPLAATWDTVNQSALSGACAWEWGGLLHFALPANGDAYNNLVLCFAPDTGAWWPYDGIEASCFTLWEEEEGSGAVPLTGSSADGYMVSQGVGTTDFGEAIEAYWTTDLLDMGHADWRKKFLRLIATSYPACDAACSVLVLLGVDPEIRTDSALSGIADWFTAKTLTAGYSSDTLRRRYDFPHGSYCHYMQAKIYHNASDRLMKIKSLVFHFKPQRKGA